MTPIYNLETYNNENKKWEKLSDHKTLDEAGDTLDKEYKKDPTRKYRTVNNTTGRIKKYKDGELLNK